MQYFSSSLKTVSWQIVLFSGTCLASRKPNQQNPKVNSTYPKRGCYSHFMRTLRTTSVHMISLNWTSPNGFVINYLSDQGGGVRKTLEEYEKQLI